MTNKQHQGYSDQAVQALLMLKDQGFYVENAMRDMREINYVIASRALKEVA